MHWTVFVLMMAGRMLLIAGAFLAMPSTSVDACMQPLTPQRGWKTIDHFLPQAKLSAQDLTKIAELRLKVSQTVEAQRKDGERLIFDAERYRRAVDATREAMKIVGIEEVGSKFRGCGGEYRLKNKENNP
jgi:hypothetical protein